MTEFQVTSWRDIPSMVASRDGDEIVKIPLHQRCQEAKLSGSAWRHNWEADCAGFFTCWMSQPSDCTHATTNV